MPTGARAARTSDCPAVGELQARAWRSLYAGILPPAALSALDPGELADAWGDAILHPPTPLHRLLVALEGTPSGDVVVGYAAFEPAVDGAGRAIDGTVELLDLVIEPERTRRGHGSRLMSAVVDTLLATGSVDTLLTWIPAGDGPRRAFLESCGWGPDGAYRDLESDGTTTRQVRLVTLIGPGTPDE